MRIAVIFGSKSDLKALIKASYNARELYEDLGFEVVVSFASAHRNPEELEAYLKECWAEGVRYFVAVAGMAAHLAGKIASTLREAVVYAVPMPSENFGITDSLTGSLQMPPFVPVRTMTPGKIGFDQAPICLAQDIAVTDPEMATALVAFNVKHNPAASFAMTWSEAEERASPTTKEG
jgi:5-(carboxyamino)imidazole ribonucleotide mutase